jgi:AcrR family transcriptional regulator
MTFYRNFKNKEEIALSILKTVFEKSIHDYRSIMDQKITFSKKIQQLISMDKNFLDEVSSEFINDLLL